MSIIVNGNVFRTLAEPLYVNGKHVIEAYANGEKVYPADELSGHFFKIRGKIQRHVHRYIPYVFLADNGWSEPLEWLPFFVDYDYSASFAALLEIPTRYRYEGESEWHIFEPAKATLGISTYGIDKDPITSCIPQEWLHDDGNTITCFLDSFWSIRRQFSESLTPNRIYGSKDQNDYIYPQTWQIRWTVPNPIEVGYDYPIVDGQTSMKYSIICKLNISNPVGHQSIHFMKPWWLEEDRGTIEPMQLMNYPAFNGIYGPYYCFEHRPKDFVNPKLPGKTRGLDYSTEGIVFQNDQDKESVWALQESNAFNGHRQPEQLIESINYYILEASCLSYGHHFRGNGWYHAGPTRDIDQTFVKMMINHKLGSHTILPYSKMICPITDILYCGEHNTAPEWAKTLSESDLL